jgi:type III secretory pathway component EscU
MRVSVSKPLAVIRAYFAELVILAACGLTCYGISLIFLPAALIVGGVLVALAVIDWQVG